MKKKKIVILSIVLLLIILSAGTVYYINNKTSNLEFHLIYSGKIDFKMMEKYGFTYDYCQITEKTINKCGVKLNNVKLKDNEGLLYVKGNIIDKMSYYKYIPLKYTDNFDMKTHKGESGYIYIYKIDEKTLENIIPSNGYMGFIK